MAKRKFSFAHLVGFGARQAENDTSTDDEKDQAAETDEEVEQAEGDDEDAQSESQDDVTDDEGDDEDESEKEAKAARADERRRCAAIFAAPEAQGRVALACELAFNTDLTASAAIGIMKATPTQKTGRLAGAMAALSNPQVGADDGPRSGTAQSEEDKLAASIINAGKQARRRR